MKTTKNFKPTKKEIPLLVTLGGIAMFCLILAVSQAFASTSIDWSEDTLRLQDTFDSTQIELTQANTELETAREALAKAENKQTSIQQSLCSVQIALAQNKYTDVSVSPLTEDEKLTWYSKLTVSAESGRQCLGK